jgi:chromosome segregation ATPase
MEQVMSSDFLRTYAVDVETDSTIAQDDTLEREQRNETSETVSGMLQQLVPAIQAGQMPADLVKSLMLFTVRTTKYGREFEDAINQLPDNQAQLGQLQQQTQQAQQQAADLQKQLQDAQGQLAKANQGKEQRENFTAQVDAQDTTAAAQLKQVQAAQIAQQVQQGNVLPFGKPPA